ncbi:MAG: YciI family protein [Pseudomonadota bacterium]
MQYMLLIFDDEQVMHSAIQEAGFEAYMAPWMSYSDELQKAGVMVSGEPLSDGHTASTVSMRDGKRQVQDGPFIDSKEQLGGFYIIDVPNLDDALGWAEKCPAASTGYVEVRPIADFSGA